MLSLYLKIGSILGVLQRRRKGKEQAKWWTLFNHRS